MVQWLTQVQSLTGEVRSHMLHNQKTRGGGGELEGAQTFTSSLDLANFWTRVQMILKAAQLRVPAFQSCGFAVCLFLQRESEC